MMAIMITPTLSDIARALADHVEDIAVALLGKPSYSSRSEYRWGRRGSLWLGLAGAKRGRWYDHERGEGGDVIDLIARERNVGAADAIKIVERDFLGGAPGGRTRASNTPRQPAIDDDAEARTGAALRIWSETTPIKGTLAERYFVEHRELDVSRLELDHALRWHKETRAVIGLMTDPRSGGSLGIHRTFLQPDGTKLKRKMLGRQGVVRLSPDDSVTMGLGITEGVEDGLAVLLSGWAPVWAATSAGAVGCFPALSGIGALTIFADADTPGIEKAEACAARWRSTGLLARISHPRGAVHV